MRAATAAPRPARPGTAPSAALRQRQQADAESAGPRDQGLDLAQTAGQVAVEILRRGGEVNVVRGRPVDVLTTRQGRAEPVA